MDSYSEVRRVRKAMSERAGHDIRTLIATINNRWPSEAARALDPGTKAERCDTHGVANTAIPNGEPTQAAR
jgi:hypothetical protein